MTSASNFPLQTIEVSKDVQELVAALYPNESPITEIRWRSEPLKPRPADFSCHVCHKPITDANEANAQWYKGQYLRADAKYVHKGDCSDSTEKTMPYWKTLSDYLEELDGPDAAAMEAERGEIERVLAELETAETRVQATQERKPLIVRADPKFEDCCADKWQSYFPSRSEAVAYVLVRLAYKYESDEDVIRLKMERTELCQAWNADKGKWDRLAEQEIGRALKYVAAHPQEQRAGGAWAEDEMPRTIQVIRFSSLKPEPIRWVWKGYLAARKLTMLNGEPGHGKSLVSLDIAARVTTGHAWADGQTNALPPSSVILLTEEEDPADTILPRFLAAGGDPDKLVTFTVSGGDFLFSIEDDLPHVEQLMDADTKLVILDPVADYTRAKQNVDAEVRPVLNKLAKWAREHDLAVLGINHLNKKTDLSALHRVAGARAWVSVARLNFLLGKGQTDGLRHVCPLKMNLAADSNGSLDYTINATTVPDEDGHNIEVPLIEWRGKGAATVDDLTAPKPRGTDSLDPAGIFLKQALEPWGEWQDSGPIVAKAWEAAQISQDRLQKWLKRLGGEWKNANTVPRRTLWRLPAGTVAPSELDGAY